MLVITTGGAVREIAVAPSFLSKPNPTAHTNVFIGTTPAIPYSSLLNSGPSHQTHNTPEILDGGNQDPFRYSRDQLVSLWRNGTTSHGGLGWSLGIEVERYEGIVLDFEGIPACSRELPEAEQKVPSHQSFLCLGSDFTLRLQVYSQGSLNSRRPSISHTLSEHRRDDHVRRGIALNGDGEPTGLGILGRRGTADGLSLATAGKGFGSFVTNGPLSPMKDRFARRGLSLSTHYISIGLGC